MTAFDLMAGAVPPVTEPGGKASAAAEPGAWLLEEYKLLSAHYFHEDNYFLHVVTAFTTLNSGLIAFYASDLVSTATMAHYALPVIGLMLTVAWTISMLRTREMRSYAQRRMVAIESELHRRWEHLELPMRPLDIGTRAQWRELGRIGLWGRLSVGWLRNIPATKLAFLLPLTFTVIWIVLLAT